MYFNYGTMSDPEHRSLVMSYYDVQNSEILVLLASTVNR